MSTLLDDDPLDLTSTEVYTLTRAERTVRVERLIDDAHA